MICLDIPAICYIVGASPDFCRDAFIFPKKKDLVIAADGGYDVLTRQGVVPDYVLGDFDSIEKLPEHNNIIRHPVEKDDTDTFLSYKLGSEKGYDNFVIFGGVGGRIDHTIANIQTLAHIAKAGKRGFLIGDGAILTSIYNGKIVFPNDYIGKISLFSQDGTAENVTIKGLKYETTNILLNSYTPLGVSNEFVGERAGVSVGNGCILLIWYEKYADFFNHINNFLL